jgi:threonine/homoserine/homoserine lactone efflux protein
MQVGLATAAGFCATGLFSLLDLIPSALEVMAVTAAGYLLYLAYRIASAPVGVAITQGRFASSFTAGLLLGLFNSKAFIAFVSLFASQTIMAGDQRTDTIVKWLLVVVIMIVVDLIWLSIGAALRRAALRPVRKGRSMSRSAP